MKTMDFLAFDMGASNGRGIIGRYDGQRLTMHPVGGFENSFAQRGETAHWDLQNLHDNIKRCFIHAKRSGFEPLCFGVDTWGVDYGLLDKHGRVLGDPRAYRAARDEDMHAAHERIARRRLFDISGIASHNFNTVYQLYRRVLKRDTELKDAHTLLLMPDLLGYLLTGVKKTEYTIASTSGLMDIAHKDWSREVTAALHIPADLLTEIDQAGTLRGYIKEEVAQELGLGKVAYAAVGCHDTASAVAAIPGQGNFAFCSSGTWSLFGMETEQPVLTDYAYQSGFSNEGTVQGGFRPLRNIMGLWLIQECRREWAKAGENYNWDQIVALAQAAPALRSIVDPDDAPFFGAGDMPEKIRAYCRRTGQHLPQTVGEIARCVYESLALKYRWVLERLSEMKGQPFDSLNIVGGGIQNRLLNQMAADSLQLPVTVGPTEGAAMGNVLMQMVALGDIADIHQAREVARASVETATYLPEHSAAWDDAYARLLRYMEGIEHD